MRCHKLLPFRVLWLHPGTLFVVVLCTSLMVLVNYGGSRDVIAWLKGGWCVRCTHGWPLTYLIREYPPGPTNRPDFPLFELLAKGLDCLDIWSPAQHVCSFSLLAFAGDVAVALLIVAAAGAGAELWFRRKLSRLQFGLSHLLFLFIVAALLLGWFSTSRARYEQEVAILARIEENGGEATGTWVVPEWLFRMMPAFLSEPFVRIVEVDFTGSSRGLNMDDATLESLVDDLRRLSNLRILRLHSKRITDNGVARLTILHRLELLDLNYTDLVSAEAIRDLEVAMPAVAILDETMFGEPRRRATDGAAGVSSSAVEDAQPPFGDETDSP